jgi:hypothetical protein
MVVKPLEVMVKVSLGTSKCKWQIVFGREMKR